MNHTDAMELAAYAHLFGDNLRQDIEKAKELFNRLADQGAPQGQMVWSFQRMD